MVSDIEHNVEQRTFTNIRALAFMVTLYLLGSLLAACHWSNSQLTGLTKTDREF